MREQESEMVDTAEAARITGVPAGTLKAWRADEAPQGPPYRKLGRIVRYSRAELRKWLDAGRVDHSAEVARG